MRIAWVFSAFEVAVPFLPAELQSFLALRTQLLVFSLSELFLRFDVDVVVFVAVVVEAFLVVVGSE